MANRRMFSKEIIGSDLFLDLPVSCRELYFELGMYADDDGFVSPKKVMRIVGSSDDDLKVLITKKFVLPFASGVIVIRHWRDNNYIRPDRYQPTQYQEELKEALNDSIYRGLPMVDQVATQYRIGKDSIDKDKENTDFSLKNKKPYSKFCGKPMWYDKVKGKWFVIYGQDDFREGTPADVAYK